MCFTLNFFCKCKIKKKITTNIGVFGLPVILGDMFELRMW